MAIPNMPQKGDNNWDVTLGAAMEWLNSKIDQKTLVKVDTAPTSADSPGIYGQFTVTATHFYLCVATNSWIKIALASW
jgi:hypothetical protein